MIVISCVRRSSHPDATTAHRATMLDREALFDRMLTGTLLDHAESPAAAWGVAFKGHGAFASHWDALARALRASAADGRSAGLPRKHAESTTHRFRQSVGVASAVSFSGQPS